MSINRIASMLALGVLLGFAGLGLAAHNKEAHTTNGFQGPKANTGKAFHSTENGKSILRVSKEFVVPDTPAPTWRIVDGRGNIHTLDAFKIKGGEKREIVVPNYVHDISKVQVYCAWAEVLLGEASFSSPVK